MNNKRAWACVTLLILALIGLTPRLEAQQDSPNPDRPRNAQNQRANANRFPPPVDHGDSISARKEQAAAKATIEQAESELSAVIADLKKRFERSEELKAARAALAKAEAELEWARGPVLEALAQKPEYRAAKEKKTQAEAKRDAQSASAGSPEKTQAATEVLKASAEVSRIEAAALNADPAVGAARAKLKETSARLSDLTRAFEESIKTHPKVQAARTKLDEAKVKLAASTEALKAAEEAEARQEAQRNQQIQEINRRNAPVRRAPVARRPRPNR